MFSHERSSEHRGSDDLLTAGLGLAGLRTLAPPSFADPLAPTAGELRRRALWSSWRGIADLAPGGGYGELFGDLSAVPGREFSAYATLPGARQPHRVLAQVPDSFDTGKRCVLVAPASGSRGIYGAVAVAAAWGLPRGCAVVYTDKGAGSDYFDLDAQQGVRADGTVGELGAADDLAFVPEAPMNASGVAFRHAHSQDNPEADWGRHVKQAAQFALHALDQAHPQAAPFTFDNTRVIAVGISNGGGAVLRAAELEGGWLDAVVAGEPSVLSDGPGARALYDYTTEAALLMPCALLHMDDLPQPPLTAAVQAGAAVRCASLATAGQLPGATTAEQARAAYERLRGSGWSDEALRAGALSVGFDLWRAVAATYASAYGRYGVDEHPCGYGFAAQNTDFSARAATAAERAAWFSDGSGIPPGAGVGIIDGKLAMPDLTLAGLQCLRALWEGEGEAATRVRAGIEQTRAGLPRKGLPVVVVHGLDDGLIPPAFSSAPYVVAAQAAGRDVRYWQVRHAQHFDGFLGLPDYAARYVPLLPYVYAALDRVQAHLDDGAALPADAVIATTPRGAGKPLTEAGLAIPR
ncbi:D-(-)-3-hydroxybutyrate oligomer hydrolase [Flavobacterium sp. MXW15]|uniref:D-(-)-3-hydroxybutyrate oligomer hydrolase n=1 Tax=Xanthomonas chitinilytica TaxID=2989819 RepID=A0ABT3JUL2_9XANT|nr:D-(-)-3-hydroxybutyrate oligomer hydrolase [Xanthomonas sp. H13-6]MCW4453465.1 D-(-)-3-hydroxybutyrate oligomer hydrolase [Flavobacterium sp. MXW15]MCW4472182.1 D-(-)-3-hydroxybutyrate oligomer hydrolase [Xanthomonas sp. H13-6]